MTLRKRITALLVALCMAATLGLAGCGNNSGGGSAVGGNAGTSGGGNAGTSGSGSTTSAQMISGEFTGQVGVLYGTQWFDFTVNSKKIGTEYAGYDAGEGNELLIANITITNTSGSPQPFGTFDWFVDDTESDYYYYPLDPHTDNMMPEQIMLDDGDTITYDVVIEFPADLPNPFVVYVEMSVQETRGATFMLYIR